MASFVDKCSAALPESSEPAPPSPRIAHNAEYESSKKEVQAAMRRSFEQLSMIHEGSLDKKVAIQYFDVERDIDPDEDAPATKRGSGRILVDAASRIAPSLALTVATGGPGFVFGVGMFVGSKMSTRVQKRRVKSQDGHATIKIEALKGFGLEHRNTGAFGRRPLAPYVICTLIMEGLSVGGGPTSRYKTWTSAQMGGGSDCVFSEGKECLVALPIDDTDKAKRALLQVDVMDKMSLGFVARGVGKMTGKGKIDVVGRAVLALGQLVNELTEDGSEISCPVNLNLTRAPDPRDDCATQSAGLPVSSGVIRIRVTLSCNNKCTVGAASAAATAAS